MTLPAGKETNENIVERLILNLKRFETIPNASESSALLSFMKTVVNVPSFYAQCCFNIFYSGYTDQAKYIVTAVLSKPRTRRNSFSLNSTLCRRLD